MEKASSNAHPDLRIRNKLPRNAERGSVGIEEVKEDECRVEQCPDCQQELVSKSLEDHRLQDPNHLVVPCELNYAGCDFKGPRYLMARHLESSVHLSLAFRLVKEEKDRHQKQLKVIAGVMAVILVLLCYDKYNAALEIAQLKHGLSTVYTSHTNAQANELVNLKNHIKLLQDSLDEVDSRLSSNHQLITDLSLKIDLLKHYVKKELVSDLEGATRDLQQLRGEFKEVKSILVKLGFDVKNLKDGFTKKYIDDTIRALVCKFLPKSITSC